MSYIKQTWENGVSPLSGERMTHIEDGIYANSTEVAKKADKTDLTNPFNFKGSTTYASLPTSGNTVNDTYYCTDKNCNYSWTGSAWEQSGFDESAYAGELSEVKKDLGGYELVEIYDKDGANQTGYFLASDGTLTESSFQSVYGFVELPLTSTLQISMATAVNSPAICFYDSEQTYISGVSYANRTTFEVSVPTNAVYIKFSVLIADVDTFSIKASELAISKNYNNLLNGLGGYTTKEIFDKNTDIVNGYYISKTGELSPSSTVSVCGFIELPYTKTVTVSMATSGNSPAICFYDKNKTFIGGESYSNRTSFSLNVPSDAHYIKVSVITSVIDSFSIIAEVISIEKDIIEEGKYSDITMYSLGDSITYGMIPRNDESYPGQLNSYVKLAAKKFGFSLTNLGVSGATLSEYAGYTNIVDVYENIPDTTNIVTLMAGTNDWALGVPVGTMSDRGRTTFYGALHIVLGGLYKKLFIDDIAENGEKKIVIVMTPLKRMLASSSEQGGNGTYRDYTAYNNAIKEVANYYSFPVIDMYNISQLNPHLNLTLKGTVEGFTDYYNKYMTDGIHPTQEGAYIMAQPLIEFLNGWVQNL